LARESLDKSPDNAISRRSAAISNAACLLSREQEISMARTARKERCRKFSPVLAAAAILAAWPARASTFSVLHLFQGTDGGGPLAGLLIDTSGDLIGTASDGPKKSTGVVFKLATDGTMTILHVFRGKSDGHAPSFSTLVADPAGNLYGTTVAGGALIGGRIGTVFKIAPNGSETILHAFSGAREGQWPEAGLALDASGNLYGTTFVGGAKKLCSVPGDRGCGVVFKIAPDGTETLLHAFVGPDGANPFGGSLLMDNTGSLYGVAYRGGTTGCVAGAGCGTVFKISSSGALTVLHDFQGGADGSFPQSSLVADDAGNLYGTTYYGGGTGCTYGCGTIFELAPDGTETVLYAFQGGADGKFPAAGVIRDAQGNLYGTASAGGDADCAAGYGCGTVFKLAPDGTFTVLHSFQGNDGVEPFGGLVADRFGNLYGTAEEGGTVNAECPEGCGTIFELTP
jgi:uncharacterized repeat protein (TIGR03803 family)